MVKIHHGWSGELDAMWYLYDGFRTARKRISVIKNILISDSVPVSITHSNYTLHICYRDIGEQVVKQREWDEYKR